LLKKPFVDKSKWFKEVPAEEWKEAPAPAPTLKPSIASGKLKETSNLPPSKDEEMETLDFRDEEDEFIKEDGSGKFNGDGEDDFQILQLQ
jgi:hypothetical protein